MCLLGRGDSDPHLGVLCLQLQHDVLRRATEREGYERHGIGRQRLYLLLKVIAIVARIQKLCGALGRK